MAEGVDHHLSAVKMFFKARGGFLVKDKFDQYLTMPEVRAEISRSICDRPDFSFAKDIWMHYKQELSNDFDFLSRLMEGSGSYSESVIPVVQEMYNDIKNHAIEDTVTRLCAEILGDQSGDAYNFFCSGGS